MPAHKNEHSHEHSHALPLSMLFKVFFALLLLTIITVAASRFDFGSMNTLIAILIATVKASLVALYFMHLRYDNKFYLLILLASLMFVFVFLFPTLFDLLTRGINDPFGVLMPNDSQPLR